MPFLTCLYFVTYGSKKNRISLKDELKQLNNFIQLQFLKDDHFDNINIHIGQSIEISKITPMLLLSFIENSFKHSNFEDKENGWIKIVIRQEDRKLIKELSNSAIVMTTTQDKMGGVGMENVKKRFALVYPEKHELWVKQDATTCSLKLELDLKE